MEKYIYGINPVFEALNSGNITISGIVVQAGKENKRVKKILKLAGDKNIPVHFSEKDDTIFKKNLLHQGIVATVSKFTYVRLDDLLAGIKDDKNAKLIFLDCIEDPHNLGALIRSACAFGFDGVVIQDKRSAAVTAAVIKASSGTIFHIPICLVNNLNNALTTIKEHGFWSIGTALKAERFIHELDMDLKIALIIGNEEKGIRPLIEKHCDFLVKIPISEKVNSLNASAAGACAMYEIARQQAIMETS
jgi:23S rRNA (guanosine2251-2'-O)-methyltransferase